MKAKKAKDEDERAELENLDLTPSAKALLKLSQNY